jgi:hypothetical protein
MSIRSKSDGRKPESCCREEQDGQIEKVVPSRISTDGTTSLAPQLLQEAITTPSS